MLAGKHYAILWWSVAALALLAVGLIFPRGAQLYGNTYSATLLLFIGLSIEILCVKQQPVQTQTAVDFRSPGGT